MNTYTEKTMSELKPCNHCKSSGGVVRINKKKVKNAQGFIKYVYCGMCQARGPKAYSDEEAATLWNTRADNSEPLEALKELVFLKGYKDKIGITPLYIEKQPKAWEAAKQAISNAEK